MYLKKVPVLSNHLRFLNYSLKDTLSCCCHTRASGKEHTRVKGFPQRMSAWQVTSFANGGKVELSKNVPTPIITHPHHVLVKVSYASVNPLDVEMISGFGHTLLKNKRLLSSLCGGDGSYELPIILGRDFSGVVVARGSSVTDCDIGDQVYGVIHPEYNGCHAEYALAYDSWILRKPSTLSASKASGILYTTLTAWNALRVYGFGGIKISTNYPFLVIGASGGVGQAAIQLLKAWDCHVIATCRTDAIPVVQKLSPDLIVDYTQPNYMSQIEEACRTFPGKYCLILDAAGLPDNELVKYNRVLHEHATIVTLRSPLLPNVDRYGLVLGGLKTLKDFVSSNMNHGSSTIFAPNLRWAYFHPYRKAMDEINVLAEERKLDTEIEKIYAFPQADQAYSRMKAGHLRGKIIISFGEENS